MTSPIYKHPPITEAVIGIYFEARVNEAEISVAQDKFSTNYPQHQLLENLSFKVAVGVGEDMKKKATTAVDEEVGHRRSSLDMTELLVILPSAFIVSQLAPYPGWDVFFARFVRDWKVMKRQMGFRQITRVGVRYINRIDIPVSGPILEHEEYLNVYPKIPDTLGPISAYGIQTVLFVEDIGCRLNLNSAVVPSPILDHASFVIDQDIVKEANPPQSDEDIFALLNRIRERKNQVFEACVTDRARGLFQL